MAQSIRILYRNVQGTTRVNYNWGPIGLDSAVIVTAAEFTPVAAGVPVLSKTLGRPHLGSAKVYVTNVGPHGPEGGEGGVEFLLHVEWGSPLNVVVTITVLEDIVYFHS